MNDPVSGSTAAPQALVIDDDTVQQTYFEMCLTRMGYGVTLAGDGMAALSACRERNFDLVICDIRMPRLNGINFIQNVKRMSPNAAKKIIVISSIDDKNVHKQALDAGAAAMLVKPVSVQKLTETIKSLAGT